MPVSRGVRAAYGLATASALAGGSLITTDAPRRPTLYTGGAMLGVRH